MKKLTKKDILIILLITWGFVQTFAFTFNFKILRGISLASMASPLPIVFTQFRGLETFAQKFILRLHLDNGDVYSKEITPKMYSKVSGPYNLRNVYGAAISYGAKFETEKEMALLDGILKYGICTKKQLLIETGLPTEVASAVIEVHTKTRGESGTLSMMVECAHE